MGPCKNKVKGEKERKQKKGWQKTNTGERWDGIEREPGERGRKRWENKNEWVEENRHQLETGPFQTPRQTWDETRRREETDERWQDGLYSRHIMTQWITMPCFRRPYTLRRAHTHTLSFIFHTVFYPTLKLQRVQTPSVCLIISEAAVC